MNQEEFDKTLNSISFAQAHRQYMMAIKLLIVTGDTAPNVNDLELLYEICQKASKRLKAIIDIRRDEESNGDTLFNLMNRIVE